MGSSPLLSSVLTCRPGSVPEVREIDGDYEVTAAGFEWKPPVGVVENGRLEFNVEGDNPEGFFPVEIRYKTDRTVCTVNVFSLKPLLRLQVVDVKVIDMQQIVPYAQEVKAETVIIIL